jgi:hypothetical protein
VAGSYTNLTGRAWTGPSHGCIAQDCGHGLCSVPHSYLFDSSCHPLGAEKTKSAGVVDQPRAEVSTEQGVQVAFADCEVDQSWTLTTL